MAQENTALAAVFLSALAAGALLGVLFDAFRLFRLAFRSGKISIFVQDMLFGLLCGVVLYCYALAANRGQVRWFIPVGAAGGFALYYCTVGRLVMGAARLILRALAWLWNGFWRLLSLPFRLLWRLCAPFLGKAADFLKKILIFLKNLFYFSKKYYTMYMRVRRGWGYTPSLRRSRRERQP